MILQLIGIAIYNQTLPIHCSDVHKFFMVENSSILNGTQFLPKLIVGFPRSRSEEVINAAVEYVSFSLPRSTQSSWQVMHFEYLGLITVHLGIATSSHPSDACADYDDVVGCLRHEGFVLLTELWRSYSDEWRSHSLSYRVQPDSHKLKDKVLEHKISIAIC